MKDKGPDPYAPLARQIERAVRPCWDDMTGPIDLGSRGKKKLTHEALLRKWEMQELEKEDRARVREIAKLREQLAKAEARKAQALRILEGGPKR